MPSSIATKSLESFFWVAKERWTAFVGRYSILHFGNSVERGSQEHHLIAWSPLFTEAQKQWCTPEFSITSGISKTWAVNCFNSLQCGSIVNVALGISAKRRSQENLLIAWGFLLTETQMQRTKIWCIGGFSGCRFSDIRTSMVIFQERYSPPVPHLSLHLQNFTIVSLSSVRIFSCPKEYTMALNLLPTAFT